MARISGGELLVRALEGAGVRNVFGLAGGHLDPIFQACVDYDIRLVDTRHEAAAAHMADGFARATGRPGVALVTAGPGVTNAVTGIANAWADAIPMVCIGGRSPVRDEDRLPLQGLDQVALLRPITKYARTVLEPERIGEYLVAAYRHAVSGRPGPTFLDVPIDVLYGSVDEGALQPFATYAPHAQAAAAPLGVEQALDVLERAERPAILAGGGVMFSGAGDQLRAFAEATRIPVLTNAKARGVVPERGDLGYGSFGLIASPAVHEMAGGPPDVLLMLGARVGMFTGSSGGGHGIIPPDCYLIQVDIEAEEIGRARDVQLGLVGDIRETMQLFNDRLPGRSFRDHSRWIHALCQVREAQRDAAAAGTDRPAGPIHQARLARDVAEAMSTDGIIVADGGETASWMSDQARVDRMGSWLSHGYLGCLGVGLPFGLAAKVAHPDKRVLVITGDGAVGLNIAEFDTAVRQNIPVVVVVNNDQGWGMIRHGQRLRYGEDRVVGAELGPVRYDLVARGFGAHSELVTETAAIRPALDRAFASGLPACVNVMTDPALPHQVTVAMTAGLSRQTRSGDDREVVLPYYGRRRATTG